MTGYAQVRDEAARVAYTALRPLLKPESVHLIGIAEIADALALASDILAPAEHDAATRLPVVSRGVERLSRERDEALAAADGLSRAVGALIGRDLRRRRGPGVWDDALAILDEIADANDRPRPSDLIAARPRE
ncbi:MAG: hypothetical protein ABWY93_22670 [Mycobacterium sp.]